MLSEINLSRGFNTIRFVTKKYLIEVKKENVFLPEIFFHLVGQDDFFDFACECFFTSKHEGFSHLLSDRAAPLGAVASPQIRQGGS